MESQGMPIPPEMATRCRVSHIVAPCGDSAFDLEVLCDHAPMRLSVCVPAAQIGGTP